MIRSNLQGGYMTSVIDHQIGIDNDNDKRISYTLDIRKKHTLERQEAFLKSYAVCGTTLHAAKAAGISRSVVYQWEKIDHLGFRERWENTRHDFRESIEALCYDRIRNPVGNKGSDVLAIALLNAHYPEKYRQNVTIVDTNAKDLLSRLRKTESDQK